MDVSSIDPMGTQAAARSSWPEVKERDQNPRANGRKIQAEISAVLDRAHATTEKGRGTAMSEASMVPLLEFMLGCLLKGGVHSELTNKSDLEACFNLM